MVILLLGLQISKRPNERSAGLYVQLPGHDSRTDCGDFSVIALQISSERSYKINSEEVSNDALGGRLREIYRLKAERVLLVRADPDISFQEVATAIDTAQGAVTNLYLVLITPEAEKERCLFIRKPAHSPRLPGPVQ